MAIPKPPMTLEELRAKHKPLRDFNQRRLKSLKPMERLAVWITIRVGSMGFFLLIFGWTAIWLGWNSLAPKALQFDPPMAFVLWLFISNVIQILLMPLIMVGQTVQGAAADARADYDLRVNEKAEAEIEVILTHLEYQNEILMQMMRDMGEDVSDALKSARGDGPPKRRAKRRASTRASRPAGKSS
ncbi:DUF1003 domain-containing protein [Phenylobacterium sp.]|uniref:DUF1003 domain-containing protein n=1 Tax=Phenylobacterium sp. TaxID=1871053 RepID=UPI00121F5ED9|nr:DUF1003 domain-containing protein [Phenylobacterium sp.]THD51244.1 MAG: DUF1003 domain-containing protein [Phenylobacterium sp.]